MGICEGPNGFERTINLSVKGISSNHWRSLVAQVQEIDGVSFAEIRGTSLLVVSRNAEGKVFPKVDLVLEQFSAVPVGITREQRQATTTTSRRDRAYVNQSSRRRR